MNKESLRRLLELRKEAESLPTELLSERNYEIYTGTEADEDRAEVYNELSAIRENKDKIIRKIIGFLNANVDEESVYHTQLSKITFRPKEGIFNIIHYKNNEAWRFDRTKLLNLLEILENEIREKMNLPKNYSESSIFSSGLFWTILPLFIGLSYFFGIYKAEFDKSETQKELNKAKFEIQNLKNKNILLKRKIDSLKASKKLQYN
ncbi:hypothetical protein [Epilithonimonas lactis]|uniref:Uncharacterized protein n=1 Tax=Epilithonimonas lactis TaxID=421072 RepID=A0A085B5T2_9FLAO|nr:hypothetical protein [Epilithonimonas lactis]KFC17827.1 hypothetical protein IO89_20365 [Epilithonimonas lactis]SEQ98852.1 hypothetical protein SAMN04488097_3638 [Epilithonimonas lactis]